MTKSSNSRTSDPLVRELSEIKKLLILDLLSRGVKQGAIAKMLGMDQGNFSRIYPTRGILKAPKEPR